MKGRLTNQRSQRPQKIGAELPHRHRSDDRVDLRRARTLQMPTTAVPICLYKLEVLNPKQKYQMSKNKVEH